MKRILGFWVDERDIWSGGQYVKPSPTPAQFYATYFNTPPYPDAILLSISFSPTGLYVPTIPNYIAWYSQLAQLCAKNSKKMIFLYFVDKNGVWDNTGQVISSTWLGYFDSLMSALKQSSSAIEGIQLEDEYLVDSSGAVVGTKGATPELYSAFIAEVEKYGLTAIAPSSGDSAYFKTVLDYSQYPYFNDVIHTTGSGPKSIGVGYGETGAGNDIWTQAVINNIIDQSFGNPYVLIYCERDNNNPAGGTIGHPLWNSLILRGWIWANPIYQSEYQFGNGIVPPSAQPTSLTLTLTVV
jgi:hypothetical protein